MDQCQGNRFRYETVSDEYDIPPRRNRELLARSRFWHGWYEKATIGVGARRMNIHTVATAVYAMGEMLERKHEAK